MYRVSCSFPIGFFPAEQMCDPGDPVELCFSAWGTDTSYEFIADADDLKVTFETGRGYVIRFTMPEHDVVVSFSSRNCMMNNSGPTFSTMMGSGIVDLPSKPEAEKIQPVKEGEWRCPACGNVNSGRFCTECGGIKPEGE